MRVLISESSLARQSLGSTILAVSHAAPVRGKLTKFSLLTLQGAKMMTKMHVKIKITEILREKKPYTRRCNTVNPHVPLLKFYLSSGFY